MRYPVLIVGFTDNAEPQLLIEWCHPLLSGNPNGLIGEMFLNPSNPFEHELFANSSIPSTAGCEHSSNRRFRELMAGYDHPQIGDQLVLVIAPHQVPGVTIQTVCILIGAVLFDHEDTLPKRQNLVELVER